MKNAAFVKMRDSVSFCKQILIEYVLRFSESSSPTLYTHATWSVRGFPQSTRELRMLRTGQVYLDGRYHDKDQS